MKRPASPLLAPLLALTAALALNALIIAMAGRDPAVIISRMAEATLGSPYGTGQILFNATTLLFSALAVILPFRMKLFNIGAEGQLQMAAFAAAVLGSALPGWLPAALAIPACIAAAMATGALWAMLAAFLKVRFGVNEVISTIMLNFIAQGITGYFLIWHLLMPATLHTAPIIESAWISQFDAVLGLFRGSPANMTLFLALATAIAFWLLLFRTRAGYELRAAGMEPDAAAYAGISASRQSFLAMGLGGAAAGLGAANLVLGYKHYYEAGMSEGIGFTGIAAALLAGAHPLWAIPSALFFSLLEYGGLSVNAWIPKDIFLIMQAVTILVVIAFRKR